MDFCELKVDGYLRQCGYTDIVFEPEGHSRPPDFLVNGTIAVEATRLIEHELVDGQPRGLSETYWPLFDTVESIAKSVGQANPSRSWFVHGTVLKRPFKTDKAFRNELRSWFEEIDSGTDLSEPQTVIKGILRLKLSLATKDWPTTFRMGVWGDLAEGGFVLGLMEQNIKYCVAEKSEKMVSIKHKYKEWWLALVDGIAHGMDSHEIEILRKVIGPVDGWDRVIIIDPGDFARSFHL